jgi:hypothetical protein
LKLVADLVELKFMHRIAGSIRSIVLAAISRLTGVSHGRTSLKFIAVMLAVLLPCSLIFFAPNVRSQNVITVNVIEDPGAASPTTHRKSQNYIPEGQG